MLIYMQCRMHTCIRMSQTCIMPRLVPEHRAGAPGTAARQVVTPCCAGTSIRHTSRAPTLGSYALMPPHSDETRRRGPHTCSRVRLPHSRLRWEGLAGGNAKVGLWLTALRGCTLASHRWSCPVESTDATCTESMVSSDSSFTSVTAPSCALYDSSELKHPTCMLRSYSSLQ